MTVARREPVDDEVTRLTRYHWNTRAATFDDEHGHGLHSQDQREAWLSVLARLAGDTPQTVLDVGCGTGFLALLLAELGHSVTGIDLAPQMLNLAWQKARRAHLTAQFRLENVVSLGDPDGSYDLVVARHVIWVLPDPARAVGECLRVLRSGGRLALIEGAWSHDGPKAEGAVISKTTLAAVMSATSRIACRYVGQTSWAFLRGKLYNWRYRQIQARLPFFGGPSAERLAVFLRAQGLHDITIEPLMSPLLWGEVPHYPRYLVAGRR